MQPFPSVVGPEVTPLDVTVLSCVLTRLGLHADNQQLPVLEQAAAEARNRLRRAVAAHWRDDVDEKDAIHEILNAAFTGILPHCKFHGKSRAPIVIPAIYLELGFATRRSTSGCGPMAIRRSAASWFTIFPKLSRGWRTSSGARCRRWREPHAAW